MSIIYNYIHDIVCISYVKLLHPIFRHCIFNSSGKDFNLERDSPKIRRVIFTHVTDDDDDKDYSKCSRIPHQYLPMLHGYYDEAELLAPPPPPRIPPL